MTAPSITRPRARLTSPTNPAQRYAEQERREREAMRANPPQRMTNSAMRDTVYIGAELVYRGSKRTAP